jgi:hypothetical protein
MRSADPRITPARAIALALILLLGIGTFGVFSRMNSDDPKIALALEKIRSVRGTDEGEYSTDAFVSLHLEELDEQALRSILGEETPTSQNLLDALVLVDAWSSKDNGTVDTYDFGLPGDVSNYLLSVRFDGDVPISVAMES